MLEFFSIMLFQGKFDEKLLESSHNSVPERFISEIFVTNTLHLLALKIFSIIMSLFLFIICTHSIDFFLLWRTIFIELFPAGFIRNFIPLGTSSPFWFNFSNLDRLFRKFVRFVVWFTTAVIIKSSWSILLETLALISSGVLFESLSDLLFFSNS